MRCVHPLEGEEARVMSTLRGVVVRAVIVSTLPAPVLYSVVARRISSLSLSLTHAGALVGVPDHH